MSPSWWLPALVPLSKAVRYKEKPLTMKYEPIIKNFPHLLHGGDYNPDQWLGYPGVIDEDFRLMGLAGCNAFSVGIFSWGNLEPREGVFEFGWLDDIMDRLARHGHKAMLATPSAAMPAWMARKYPEILRAGREGRRNFFGHRLNSCWTSPLYREKVGRIDRALAERYGSHPALAGWHVSNELGCECFCEVCVASFHDWLERRYGTIEKLNAAWWTAFWSHTFTSFAEINPRDGCVDGLTLDWRRFSTWLFCDFMRHESAILRELAPGVPVTTNFWPSGIDNWRLGELCDFIADDCYPDWSHPKERVAEAARFALRHDRHRSMKGGKPFLVMESAPGALNYLEFCPAKRPGLHKLEMAFALGHGADGTLYFQWRKGRGGCEKLHPAVVDHVGDERTRLFKEVASVAKLMSKLDAVVGSGVTTRAAVIEDMEARWAFEVSSGPANPSKKHYETIQAHHRALFTLNLPTDVIESTCDFGKYQLLVAPMLYMLRPGVAERLKRFVADGGTLVFTYFGGYVGESNLCFTGGWPGDGLRELFGIWNEEYDCFPPESVQSLRMAPGNELGLEGEFVVQECAELIHLEGAQALAGYGHQFYAGFPALAVNRFGKGKAYYLAARTGDDFLAAFYRKLVETLGLATAIPLGAPAGVHGSIRTDGKRHFLFLQNFNDHEVKVDLGGGRRRDMLSGEESTGALTLPPYACPVLETL
jgi:beta-galactosidase